MGLVVLAGSACVTPTHASSASSVIISMVQPAGEFGATEEMVSVYNNTSMPVDVTNWCLQNKSFVQFACFEGLGANVYLEPYGSAVFVSELFAEMSVYDNSYFYSVFEVTHKSSGGLVGSSDNIQLVSPDGNVVDSFAWYITLPSNKLWARMSLMDIPVIYANTGSSADWQAQAKGEVPISSVVLTNGGDDDDSDGGDSSDGNSGGGEDEDEDEDIDGGSGGAVGDDEGGAVGDEGENEGGDQNDLDDTNDISDDLDGEGSNTGTGDELVNALSLVITELLPNPSGLDAGNEFIELYNPNVNSVIDLSLYKIRIGTDSAKWLSFSENDLIPPLSYYVVFNDTAKFTLTNSLSAVRLYYDGVVAGEIINYENPPDGEAWALINNDWAYTTILTPGFENEIKTYGINENDDDLTASADGESTTPKPCAENQYRNPDTGRCKLIATATSTLTPCKEGQYRSPETNRCRNIEVEGASLAPCKEGQYRSPETNRCRNITEMTKVDHGVKSAKVDADARTAWYFWVALIGGFCVAICYALWEWRQEISSLYIKIRRKFTKT